MVACKWCEDQEDRFKYKPPTNLKHHLRKSCTFQTSDHWRDLDVLQALLALVSKVLCLRS
jgi:hypothetical protein